MPFSRYVSVVFLQLILTLLIFTFSVSADWVCNGAQCIAGRSTCNPEFPSCQITECGIPPDFLCIGECCQWVEPEPPPPPPPLPADCYSDSDCIDGNPCTVDYCLGSGSPGSLCINNPSSQGNVCLFSLMLP